MILVNEGVYAPLTESIRNNKKIYCCLGCLINLFSSVQAAVCDCVGRTGEQRPGIKIPS
jgi:hypothetical protein